MSCFDPYYTEHSCKEQCIRTCPDSCYNCCQKYYSHIVMVFAFAMAVFGLVDLIVGGKLASICPDNGALYSSLMLAQGVMSIIEGIMIFYSIGRAHEYVFFKSGLPTFQYAFVTYSLTSVFYIASLTLSGFQMTGGKALPETHGRSDGPWLSDDAIEGMNSTNCSDYHGYIIWRFVFNVIVPLSPIALVLSIVAVLLACTILAGCLSASSADDRNR